MSKRVQVESSLILLTHPDTLKFLDKIVKPAKLKQIIDVQEMDGTDINTAIWGAGASQIVTDVRFRFFILEYDVFVDDIITKFINGVEGAVFIFGKQGKFRFSIVNIQEPWIDKRTTTTAPENAVNRASGIVANGNGASGIVANGNGASGNGANRANRANVPSSPIINMKGAYRVNVNSDGTFSSTPVKNKNGNVKSFTGNTIEEVHLQVENFLKEKN